MSKKKYWQSFGELNNTTKHKERIFVKEFKDKDTTPIGELGQNTLENKGTSRRDFLKYIGFASIATSIASSCETAIKRTIPFLNKPQNTIPGEASFYATTFCLDGEVVPIIAKVRDGRPIKIEGNDLSTIYNGGTSAQIQASVLGLYDTARLRNPLVKKQAGYEKTNDFDKLDKEIISKLTNNKVVLITPSISSPSNTKIVEKFKKTYGAKHIQYDEISYSGILNANEISYHKRAIPTYRFDNAKLIVSIGADFLGTWVSPTEYSKQWAKSRKVSAKNLSMSKHFQVESLMSLTGANADERIIIRPSEEASFVAYLYNKISGQSITTTTLSQNLQNKANEISKQLIENKNKALVVSGSNDQNVQLLINAINELLGSINNTIDWTLANNCRQGNDKDMENLITDLKEKKYDTIIFAGGANPCYSFYKAQDLKQAIAKVPTSISLNPLLDESTQLCNYIIPSSHFLESWGDYEIKTGHYSFSQPTINKLFETRDWQESILKWSLEGINLETMLKQDWTKKLGSTSNLEKALQDGIYINTKEKATVKYSQNSLADAINVANTSKSSTETEVVFYQKIAIGSGAMANNPWLQEMPDPITKATWDNYAIISPAMAKKLNISVDDNYEVEVDKPIVKIKINNQEIQLPILVIPGVHPDVIGIALGYGRTDKIGKAVQGVGKNIYPFTHLHNNNITYHTTTSSITNTGDTYPLAYTQTHNSYEGREEVIKELTLQEFISNPNAIPHEREEEFKKFKNNVTNEKEYVADGTLYPKHDNPGIKWGMSIDLNSCSGCGTCVIACNAENNISVVGKKQVLKSHEMHWMRIDRYFSGDAENPDVTFQPMLCQHCDNAPCENVCPVAATNHSSEGLNQMTYNRCIGTRYCANNCPFKVRRFNWLDFNGADSFKDNQQPLIDEGAMDEVVMDMNEDLTRLVLNPDVTVRSRGVIEKCSFCVQRLQSGKIKAKKESRPLQDADIKTACMQACPTDAIVFGNINNKESQLYKLRNTDQKERLFYVLEQIHVLPNINYLAKIRNKNTSTQPTHNEH